MLKINKWKKNLIFCFLIFGVAFFCYFVFAEIIVSPSSVNENVSYLYNISINNLDSLKEVIQVNITLPLNFSIQENTINSSKSAFFVNFSNNLSWLNDSADSPLIPLNNITYFWFNAISENPGFYNFSVILLYNDSSVNFTNVSVEVKDTTFPLIEYGSLTPGNGVNVSRKNVFVNVSVTEKNEKNITFVLANSSGAIVNSITFSEMQHSINFTNLDDGIYFYNVTIFDLWGNENHTATRKITLDTTPPSVSLSISTKNSTFLSINAVITDATSGINGTCLVNRSSASISGGGNTQTISENGLSCGTSYSYNVSCYDFAGNLGSGSNSFSTDSCSVSSSNTQSNSQSDSNQNNATQFWKLTFITTINQIKEKGYNNLLGVLERVKIKMENEEDEHYVGILNLADDNVTVEVASTPQVAVIKMGETKKFDITEDNFYDLNITLNNITNNKANITIESISESMRLISESDQSNSSSEEKKSVFLGEEDEGSDNSGIFNNKVFIVILAIVGVAVLGVAAFFIRKKLIKKKRGYK